MRAILVASLLALVGLAGCSDDTGGAQTILCDECGTPTKDTGVIRGVVVDATIAPVEGVTLTLRGQGTEDATTSDASGVFFFEDLEPGTYFVSGDKPGYAAVQQSVDVIADVEPPVTRMLMEAIPGTAPSFEVYQFSGFLECNVVVVFVFVPCQVPLTGESIGNDQFEAQWELTGNASFVHVSMVWEPTQPVGTELYFNVLEPEAYDIVGYNGGPSPLTADVPAGDLGPINAAGLLGIEVSGNGEQGLAGAELQQPFEAYVVVFHNFVPQEGYAYWKDGDPEPPQ